MSNRPIVEDCFAITPSYNNVDYAGMRKFGVDIEYHIEGDGYILVTVRSNAPQRIEIADMWECLVPRRYFICPGCEKRVYKIYLLPDGKELRCRKCHHLRYTLTMINKNTPHGKMLYALNRMGKLSTQREKIGTILYKGNLTHRFQRFLRQCTLAGYTKAVEDATGLMKALKEFQRV